MLPLPVPPRNPLPAAQLATRVCVVWLRPEGEKIACPLLSVELIAAPPSTLSETALLGNEPAEETPVTVTEPVAVSGWPARTVGAVTESEVTRSTASGLRA